MLLLALLLAAPESTEKITSPRPLMLSLIDTPAPEPAAPADPRPTPAPTRPRVEPPAPAPPLRTDHTGTESQPAVEPASAEPAPAEPMALPEPAAQPEPAPVAEPVRGGSGGLRYEFTAFQMDFDNQITPAISGGLANANANAGSTLHRGLETAVNYRWNNGFSIDGNLTWIPVSEYRENRGGGIIEGNRLPNSPELLANLSVGYASGPSDVALLWHYVDEQFGSGDNSVPIAGSGNAIWSGLLPSYYTVDLTDNYDLNKQLKIFGAVKNLIDEHYIAGLRQGIYAGPERAFEVGAKFTF